jgi:hypothetical protein
MVLFAILHSITSIDSPKEITIEAGKASHQVLAALICTIFMGVSTFVGIILEKKIGILG